MGHNTYRFTLSDYHAIKSADISIDGITVLAGENGCGKSTLSRWLYYIINGSQRFDEFIFKEILIEKIRDKIINLDLASRDLIIFNFRENRRLNKTPDDFIREAWRQLVRDDYTYMDVQEVESIYKQLIHQFCGQLLVFFNTIEKSSPRRKRLIDHLQIDDIPDANTEQLIEMFIAKNDEFLESVKKQYQDKKNFRSYSRFLRTVKNQYEETDAAPQHIQLYEDNVELINDKHISTLFHLQRAIYIDTPMAVMNTSTENVFWKELGNYILKNRKSGISYQDPTMSYKKLLRRIKDIIHGEAVIIENDDKSDSDELRYVSSDNSINIEIEKAATGFKTFTYLQRLLDNGLLSSDTLLLIDEPEAHLHPQWIVEYARLLVLLHKELGVKIMLATHNPDMVAAIRAISGKEDVLSNTNFYLASPSGENQYEYKNLGTEIGEIFTSFNIALSRIQLYGCNSL